MRRRPRSPERGATALEYALLIFVILVAGFLAYKYLGGSVKGSTQQADTKFDKSSSGQAAPAGQGAAAGGAGGDTKAGGDPKAQAAGAQAGGGKPARDDTKSGTPGGAGVATVQKPGTGGGGTVDNSGSGGGSSGEVIQPRPRNWTKYFLLGILVIGLAVAVITFGKKRKSTA